MNSPMKRLIDFVPRPAVDALGALVPVKDPALRLENDDGVLRLVEQRGLLLDLPLDAVVLGHVAQDLRQADDLALVVLHRRNRDKHIELAAVFAQAYALEILDSDALMGTVEDFLVLLHPVGGIKHFRRTADDFLGGIAEHPLGRSVPLGDLAVEALGDDRVVDEIEEGAGHGKYGLQSARFGRLAAAFRGPTLDFSLTVPMAIAIG